MRIVRTGIILPMIDRFPVSLFQTAFPRKRKVDDLCGRLAFNVNIFRQIGHERVDSCRAVRKLQNALRCILNNNEEQSRKLYSIIEILSIQVKVIISSSLTWKLFRLPPKLLPKILRNHSGREEDYVLRERKILI